MRRVNEELRVKHIAFSRSSVDKQAGPMAQGRRRGGKHRNMATEQGAHFEER